MIHRKTDTEKTAFYSQGMNTTTTFITKKALEHNVAFVFVGFHLHLFKKRSSSVVLIQVLCSKLKSVISSHFIYFINHSGQQKTKTKSSEFSWISLFALGHYDTGNHFYKVIVFL